MGILLILVLIAVGAATLWWVRGGGSAQARTPEFQTTEVDRGAVVQGVLSTGILNPVRTVQVGSQISGNITELLADFNSVVRAGQVVARLDSAVHEADVALARAELSRAQSSYDLARVHDDRIAHLHQRDLVPDVDRDEARVRLQQAEADLSIRQHILQKTELQLAHCTIRSPVDGIVISRNVDVGQTVAASLSAPVLFEIAEDLREMKINTHVAEADIGRIVEELRVEFRVDAYREQRFKGYVWQVRNAARMQNNVVTYDAVVHVENPDLKLKPGMTAEVRFITDAREDVLRVRNAALRARLPEELLPPDPAGENDERNNQKRIVYRLRGGSLEAVWVRVGISDGVHTEILEGLEEGDVLVSGLALRRDNEGSGGPSLLRGRQAQY